MSQFFSNVCWAEAFVSVKTESFDNINTSAKNRKLSDICFGITCLKVIAIKEEIRILLNHNIMEKGTIIQKSRFNQHYVMHRILITTPTSFQLQNGLSTMGLD